MRFVNSRGGVVDGVFRPDFESFPEFSQVFPPDFIVESHGQSVRVDKYATVITTDLKKIQCCECINNGKLSFSSVHVKYVWE